MPEIAAVFPQLVNDPALMAALPRLAADPALRGRLPELVADPALAAVLPKLRGKPELAAVMPRLAHAVRLAARMEPMAGEVRLEGELPTTTDARPAMDMAMPGLGAARPGIEASTPDLRAQPGIAATIPQTAAPVGLEARFPQLAGEPELRVALPQLAAQPELMARLPDLVAEPALALRMEELKGRPELAVAMYRLAADPELRAVLPQLVTDPALRAEMPATADADPALRVAMPSAATMPPVAAAMPGVASARPEIDATMPSLRAAPGIAASMPATADADPQLAAAMPQLVANPELAAVLPKLASDPGFRAVMPQLAADPQLAAVLPSLAQNPGLMAQLPQLAQDPGLSVRMTRLAPPELRAVMPRLAADPALAVAMPRLAQDPELVAAMPKLVADPALRAALPKLVADPALRAAMPATTGAEPGLAGLSMRDLPGFGAEAASPRGPEEEAVAATPSPIERPPVLGVDEQLQRRVQRGPAGPEEAIPTLDQPLAPDISNVVPEPIVRKDGEPFQTRQGAALAARSKKLEGAEPVEVDGGWAIQPAAELETVPTPEGLPPPGSQVTHDGKRMTVSYGRTPTGRAEMRLGDGYRTRVTMSEAAARETFAPAPEESMPAPAAPTAPRPQPPAGEEAVGPSAREPAPEAVSAVQRAEAETETDPTPAQIEAGNYRKGKVRIQGLDISIENPRGSERSGVDRNGRPWSVEMPASYGYIRRSEGADGEQMDVYVGPEPEAETVFVVDQVEADTGRFDEHKAMVGYRSQDEALADYDRAFNDGRGPERRRAVTAMPVAAFRQWLGEGDGTRPMVETKRDGTPFATEGSALLAARSRGDADAIAAEVAGGWGYRRGGQPEEAGTERGPYAPEARTDPVARGEPPVEALRVLPGRRDIASTPDARTDLEVDLAVVDAADLVVSHDPEGRVNPAYPQDMQPRERDRAAAVAKIREDSANLKPHMLRSTGTIDTGAPLVGPDAVVEQGNGRSAAILLAYREGRGDRYREMVQREAEAAGVDTSAMEAPILVRVRQTAVPDRAALGRQGNVASAAELSAPEQAKFDADTVGDDIIEQYATNPQQAMTRFASAMPGAVRTGLYDAQGRPSKALADRTQNAVLWKAYGSDNILTAATESTDPDGKQLLNALNQAAAQWAGVENGAKKSVVAAVDRISVARARGMNRKEIAEQIRGQGELLDIEGYDEGAQVVANALMTRALSGKRMGEYLTDLAEKADRAEEAQAQGGEDLLGEVPEMDVVALAQAADEETGGPARPPSQSGLGLEAIAQRDTGRPLAEPSVSVAGGLFQRKAPAELSPESRKAWEELDAIAKEAPTKESFRDAIAAGHLMDLSDRGRHRFGRAVATFASDPDEYIELAEFVEQQGFGDNPHWATHEPELQGSLRRIGRGAKTVRIWRGGVPEGAEIEVGDFVAIDRATAAQYPGHEGRDKGLVSKVVPVEDVVWGNADASEYHYSPRDFREAVGTAEEFYDQQSVPDALFERQPEDTGTIDALERYPEALTPEQRAATPEAQEFAESANLRREEKPPAQARIRLNRRFDAERQGVRGDVERIGREVFGEGFRVELAESITAPEGGAVPGAYDPATRTAYIALRANEEGMTGTLWHEGIHHLRNAGAFTNEDGSPTAAWRTLEREAAKWRSDYGIEERYGADTEGLDPGRAEDLKNEEAIAEALADYQTRGKETGFGPTVRAAFNRALSMLRFFRGVADGLRGRGFATWESIFEGDIASGAAGQRADAAAGQPSRDEVLLQRGKDAPKANKDAFDAAASKYAGADLRGAADAVIKDKDRMGGIAEDVKAQFVGTESIRAKNVQVEDKPVQSDLNPALRWLAPPTAWSKKFPAIHNLVRQGVQSEIDMSNRLQRLNRDWDKVTKKLSKDEYADLTGIMFLGDAEAHTFTADELAQFPVTPNVRHAYVQARTFIDKLGRFTEQHRRSMSLNLLTQRTKLMRRMAGARGMTPADFRTLYTARASLMAAQRDGSADPETIGPAIDAASEALHGAAAPSEEYAAWAEEADRLEPRIAETKIRKREGYVPHKFFGRWRVFRKVPPEQAIVQKGFNDQPFTTEKAAQDAASAAGGGEAVQVEGGWGFRSQWAHVAGEHGFWPNRKDAIRAASQMAKKDPNIEMRVAPVEFTFPEEQSTQLSDAAYFRFMNNVGGMVGLEGQDLREATEGVARRRFRRRIAGFTQYRKGAKGYSQNLDRVIRTHIGETVRYVSLDRLKFDAINTIEKEGLSMNRTTVQSRPQLAGAVNAWFRDVNGQKQPLEGSIDQMLNKNWVTPLRAGLAAGGLAFLASGGVTGNFVSPLVGAYIGYRVGRGVHKGGPFPTRAITGSMLGDMSHLKLGMTLNLMSAAVNTTQVVLNTLPVIGPRYVGVGIKRFNRAVASKLIGKPNADWRLMERHDIHPLNTFAEGTRHQFQKEGKLSKMSMAFFTGAEGFNRGVTFLGAMSKAQNAGKSAGEARGEARDTMNRTQFHYGSAQKPEMLRNVLLRVPGQFKNFVAQQLAFVAGLSRKEVPMFLLSMTMLAGTLGIPGIDAIDAITDWLADFSPIAWMKEQALKALAEGELAGGVATFLTRGASGLAGVDMTGRVGMGDRFLPMQVRDWEGAWVSTVKNAVRHGRENASIEDQIRNLSPGLGNPLKVLEAYRNGGSVTSPWKRGRVEYEMTPREMAMKAVGARPIREARQQDLRDIERRKVLERQGPARRFIDRIVRAQMDGDGAEVRRIYAEARAAGVPISRTAVRNAMRQMGRDRQVRGLRGLPRDMRGEGARLREAIAAQ